MQRSARFVNNCHYSVKQWHTLKNILWDIISPNKPFLVKARLQKVDLGRFYTQKVLEKLIKCSYSNTIGGPFFWSNPVCNWVKVLNFKCSNLGSIYYSSYRKIRLRRLESKAPLETPDLMKKFQWAFDWNFKCLDVPKEQKSFRIEITLCSQRCDYSQKVRTLPVVYYIKRVFMALKLFPFHS